MKRTLIVVVALLSIASPALAQAPPTAATVARIKAELLARGINLAGPCGAFAITGRVAWAVRASGWGLIFKDGDHNGCTVEDGTSSSGRYAVDALMKQDGTVVDILAFAENRNGDASDPTAFNLPVWNGSGPQPRDNWRAPFNLDVAAVVVPPVIVVVPPVVVTAPPAPVPPVVTPPRSRRGTILALLAAAVGALIAGLQVGGE